MDKKGAHWGFLRMKGVKRGCICFLENAPQRLTARGVGGRAREHLFRILANIAFYPICLSLGLLNKELLNRERW